ncbi:MAG: URC4/urg3 family protein [Ideonella sp.]|nr:URC4/urg3 family protein [Ideonella sp.]
MRDDGTPRHGPVAASVLRDPATIRSRCAAITRAVDEGRSSHFRIDRERLDAVAERVERVTLAAYPDLAIPFHSRWRHFEAGGIDRKAAMDERLADRGAEALARARVDLTVVSVLLDAGAGPGWRYLEADSGRHFSRSEGLGVASWHAFREGLFSADAGDPMRVDAAALQRLDVAALKRAFQVDAGNPLVGLEGRVALLNRLGAALAADGDGGAARPAMLYDRLVAAPGADGVCRVGAAQVLRAVLDAFSSIWLTGSVLHGVPLGDVWPHPWAGGESAQAGRHGTTAGWVPFHKLSQWLSYSLLEPLAWAGVEVGGLDALTGLPEYRNGGLLIDGGVIVPRDPRTLTRRWTPRDEFIVEWRALTVSLIDDLAPLVRRRLGRTAAELPLACLLEGGTWAAGREIARERRDGGPPPLTIDSDGTVF